jgi:hypothetical protein
MFRETSLTEAEKVQINVWKKKNCKSYQQIRENYPKFCEIEPQIQNKSKKS